MASSPDDATLTPEALLRSYIARFDPKEQKLIRAVRSALRKRLPTANELLYDYDKFFVIAYSATDHPMQGIVSTAARPDGVRLYLMSGPQLPDPKKLLQGSGKETRYICVETASRITHPDVEALIAGAIARATVPLPVEGRGKLILRSVAANRRPRKKPAK
ncbi:MAG: hypothetical protein U0527_01325 [Candidatus Eisenbacteria bacterium]